MLIINPGSGPVGGATVKNARRNMAALAADLEEAGREVTISGLGKDSEDGRFFFELVVDGQLHGIEMPGLPLEQVRYVQDSGQNIFDFPRLYVDGSSWIWCFALGVLGGGSDEEEDLPDLLQEDLPEPICIGCNRRPEEISEYVQEAADANEYRASKDLPANETPDSFVRREEGTYNPDNGHFVCTDCYIKAGQPSSPGGWIAP